MDFSSGSYQLPPGEVGEENQRRVAFLSRLGLTLYDPTAMVLVSRNSSLVSEIEKNRTAGCLMKTQNTVPLTRSFIFILGKYRAFLWTPNKISDSKVYIKAQNWLKRIRGKPSVPVTFPV